MPLGSTETEEVINLDQLAFDFAKVASTTTDRDAACQLLELVNHLLTAIGLPKSPVVSSAPMY